MYKCPYTVECTRAFQLYKYPHKEQAVHTRKPKSAYSLQAMEHDKKKVSMGNEMGENSSSGSVNQEKGRGLPVPPPPPPPPTISQHPLDPKKLRRLLNNRESNLRSRMKTEQKLKDMEQGVQSYTDQVNSMPIEIENAKNQIELLRIENHDLKTKMFTLCSNRASKEVEEVMMKKDIEKLNQLLHSSDPDH